MPHSAPTATYRIQFTSAFDLDQATRIVPYLASLGVGAAYASPIWQARPGSSHGYDVVDPGAVSRELGGRPALRRFATALARHEMGLILDVVPNHIAASGLNRWWGDLLEHGTSSPFARYFDVDWSGGPDGRIVLPVLGRPLGEVVQAGQLAFELDVNGLHVRYFDERWPLEVGSYSRAASVVATNGEGKELLRASAVLASWRTETPAAGRRRRASARALKARWVRYLTGRLGPAGDRPPTGSAPVGLDVPREAISSTLAVQTYSLEYWRDGLTRINYRRFFDIAGLAALRAESAPVFNAVHRLPLRMVSSGLATGLRIDHVDGLRDPSAYLRRLRPRCPYVIVEKILAPGEELPRWEVDGTTGYEFLNALNGVFVDRAGVETLKETYAQMTGERRSFSEIAAADKRRVLKELFAAETTRLARDLARLAPRLGGGRSIEPDRLADAIVRVTAAMPVYRTYAPAEAERARLSAPDRAALRLAFAAATGDAATSRRGTAVADRGALAVVRDALLRRAPLPARTDEKARLDFVARWQQLCGPAAAKGVEDTALFHYIGLLSLNEVGGDPSGDGFPADYLHSLNRSRSRTHRGALNATSTHDTKRSEDVRARLNVLSELAPEWTNLVEQWRGENDVLRAVTEGQPTPEPSDELLLYQTLAGAWPLAQEDQNGFEQRILAFMTKACREARARSSWLAPDAKYESALGHFVSGVLARLGPGAAGDFAKRFRRFRQRVAFFGALNSLSQVVLKTAAPGVPDFYQGAEIWDFSLTDPDNRRQVDFDRRRQMLDSVLREPGAPGTRWLEELLSSWQDGRVKLFTTARALSVRATLNGVLDRAAYHPVPAKGPRAGNLFAFARGRGRRGTWIMALVPRLTARLVAPDRWPLGATVWDRTFLVPPATAPRRWRDVFTGSHVPAHPETGRIAVSAALARFPVALLQSI